MENFKTYEFLRIIPGPKYESGLLNLWSIIEDFELKYEFNDEIQDSVLFYIPVYELIYKDYNAILSRLETLSLNNQCKLFINGRETKSIHGLLISIKDCDKYFYREGGNDFIGVSLTDYSYLKSICLNHYTPSDINSTINKDRDNFFFKLNDFKNDIRCLLGTGTESNGERKRIIMRSLYLGYFKLHPILENQLMKYFLFWR